MTNQSQNSTEDLKSNVKKDVKSAKAELAGAAKTQAEAGKEQAASKLNDLSDAIDQVADSISENDKLGLASYVRSTSSQLASLATRLQESSMDQLAEDAKQLARTRPTAFMLGSVMVGFGLSRFLKASTHHNHTGSPTIGMQNDWNGNSTSTDDFDSTRNIQSYADPASVYPASEL
jgi:CRISPR/Cas system CSM-associated protein Csm2 small subunit